jgi:pilus assembly protein CpaE
MMRPEIQKVLEGLPQLKLLDLTCDPQGYCSQRQANEPDLVLVEMDGEAHVPQWLEKLALNRPGTPVLLCSHNLEPDFLIRVMQVGVREFLPLPLQREDLEAALTRVWASKKRHLSADQRPGELIVVTGHKGGAGVTTVAVNLAVAMAGMTSSQIALVDLARPFPDVANFMDLDPTYSILDLVQNLHEADRNFIQRIMHPYGNNLFVLHGCPDFREQDSIEVEALEQILTLLRSFYQYVIVDLGHWLDDYFLQVVTQGDLVLLVTGLTVPDLRNLKKLWPAFLEMNQDRRKIKLVVNRFDRSNGLQLKDLEQIVQQPPFATLPSDYSSMMEALNRGAPLEVTSPRSKLRHGIGVLAEQVKRELPDEMEQAAAGAPTKRKFWLF